jgi:hypothetical protein
MTRTLANYTVHIIKRTRVKYVFGVVEDSPNGLTDTQRCASGLDYVHVHHEEAGEAAPLDGRSFQLIDATRTNVS